MTAQFDAILEKALNGYRLSAGDGYRLSQATGEEMTGLFRTAASLRDRLKGRVVTYSRKVFLPVTNLCADRCSYCTFRKDPGQAGAWNMTPEEIHAWSLTGAQQGCKEALMCLGDKPERSYPAYRKFLASVGCGSTVEYLGHACRIALEYGLLPHTNAGVLSRGEMEDLKPFNASMGLMLESISPRLSLKGGPHFSAPDKDPALRMQMMRDAGELCIPFTTGILVGIGETREERVDSLIAIRDLHDRYGHIQEIIIQNFRAKPLTRMAGFEEPDELEIARCVAVARLLSPGMNIQAPPNLNPRSHELLLAAGINDWGGISPVTRDYINPEAAWPQIGILAETCRGAGFVLRERLAIYPEFAAVPGFVDPCLKPRVDELGNALAEGGADDGE
jgi:7,8-didemethyl-8-hydroxy-5-deazariboflavin synthase CofG subunit